MKLKVVFKFDSLEELMEYYGKDNVVPVDLIRQQIFYAKKGVQPKFIYENEDGSGRLTCWYLKEETKAVYQEWKANRPIKLEGQ